MLRSLTFSVLLVAMAGCGRSGCINEVREELASLDGTQRVVVFSRDCSATTDFNTQATVLGNQEELADEAGNVFIIDKGTARVSWKNDGGILVVFSSGVRVFKNETVVRGVNIEYLQE